MVLKQDAEVDIGCGNAFGGTNDEEGEAGGNGGQDNAFKVIDLVDAFGYHETIFDLSGFGDYFKAYMKKVLAWLQANKPDRVDPFKAGAKDFFIWAKQNFGELSFYTGSSYDMENLIVMSYYKKPEDPAPTFIYMMDGFKSYKV